jgi:hypothetical protein
MSPEGWRQELDQLRISLTPAAALARVPAWRRRRVLLAAYAECRGLTRTADAIGISPRSLHRWIAADPDLRAAIDAMKSSEKGDGQ